MACDAETPQGADLGTWLVDANQDGTIADERVLGNASRYKEIFENKKDILQNP